MEVLRPRIWFPVALSRSRVSCRDTVQESPAGMVWVARVCQCPRSMVTS